MHYGDPVPRGLGQRVCATTKKTASDGPRCDRSVEANGGRAARDAEQRGAPSEAIMWSELGLVLGAAGLLYG